MAIEAEMLIYLESERPWVDFLNPISIEFNMFEEFVIACIFSLFLFLLAKVQKTQKQYNTHRRSKHTYMRAERHTDRQTDKETDD